MSIEWEKVLNQPTKSYKVRGEDLLNFRTKTEAQEANISELKTKQNELNSKIESLENSVREKNSKITSLEGQVAELNSKVEGLNPQLSTKDNEITDLKNTVANQNEELTNLKVEVETKSATLSSLESEKSNLETEISTKNSKIEELSATSIRLQEKVSELDAANNAKASEIAELNEKIEELKEQIPKKPVYEKAEEIIKGASCPNCGMETREEYKIVDGKRELIRKVCPNVTCGWTFVVAAEKPRLAISLEKEVRSETITETAIYQVTKTGVEKVPKLESNMVAIVADPEENIIWIWKGKNSDRFVYASATSQANYVKNDVAKMSLARVERADEGEEPAKFPKFY